MSAWRILVKNLYTIGRPSRLLDIDDYSMPHSAIRDGLDDARSRGLIEACGLHGRHVVYRLTVLGTQYAEGRIVDYAGRHPIDRRALRNTNGSRRHRVQRTSAPRHMRFHATWLASFPGQL